MRIHGRELRWIRTVDVDGDGVLVDRVGVDLLSTEPQDAFVDLLERRASGRRRRS